MISVIPSGPNAMPISLSSSLNASIMKANVANAAAVFSNNSTSGSVKSSFGLGGGGSPVNSSLLRASQGSIHSTRAAYPTSSGESDRNTISCLSWCEDRLLGINEAMMLESTKPISVTDDSKPLYSRQTELANIVHGVISTRRRNVPPQVIEVCESYLRNICF